MWISLRSPPALRRRPQACCTGDTPCRRCLRGSARGSLAVASSCASRISTPHAAARNLKRRSWQTSHGWGWTGMSRCGGKASAGRCTARRWIGWWPWALPIPVSARGPILRRRRARPMAAMACSTPAPAATSSPKNASGGWPAKPRPGGWTWPPRSPSPGLCNGMMPGPGRNRLIRRRKVISWLRGAISARRTHWRWWWMMRHRA